MDIGPLEFEAMAALIWLRLYEEEMEVIDQYIGISRESDGGFNSEAEYRAETGRFRIAAQCAGLLIRPRKAGDNAARMQLRHFWGARLWSRFGG